MPNLYLTFVLALSFLSGWGQTRTLSFGVFTGITSTYTFDEGISKDQRYQGRYDVKFAPIGLNYEIDFENVGVLFSPGITTIGQNFHVINTTGGHEGLRKVKLQYLNVPVGVKFKIIDMSFFRVSFVGSASAAYLLKGKETVSHRDAKLIFPDEIVPPVLPPTYTREYDGVLSPEVNEYQMLQKSDFKPVQVFVAAGLRSDWDVSERWRISFDLRVNYGVLEPRNTTYLNKVSNHQTLYDIAGTRRDMFVQFTIGVSRYVAIDKKDQQKKKKIKSSPKKFVPKSYPWPKPRNKSPKN